MNSNLTLPIQIVFARELRKRQTPAEEKMWKQLRNRKLLGYKFLRQHPIIVSRNIGKTSFYVADFYCSEKKLVIEIDGLIHVYQIEYDKARDMIMKEMELTVLRITNDEVETNVFEVLKKIKLLLK